MAEEIVHKLVPKHEKLSEKEAKELLERYKVTPLELPKIRSNDPAIKHLEVKRGDIVRVTRISPTAGDTSFYRVVVNAK